MKYANTKKNAEKRRKRVAVGGLGLQKVVKETRDKGR